MKTTLKASLFVATFVMATSVAAQTSVPEIPFDTNADLLQTPLDIYVGEVGGVGQNSKGQIYVYTRTGIPYGTLGTNRTFARGGSRLFEFDKTGKFVRELGQQVYGFNTAIGLRVDPWDNVWTVDEASNQIVKFDANGNVAMVLGRKPEAMAVRPREGGGGGGFGNAPQPPGSGVPGSGLNRPADLAFDKDGNIYIADGVGGNNNRVLKIDKNGDFVRHWGHTGKGDGQFEGVKAIAVDAQGNVYAADMGNKRIQVFDGDGNYKSQFAGVGTPIALCMTTGPTQYLYVSHAGDPDGMDDAAIYKVKLDGTVVGKFGSAGKLPKEFGIANSIDCRNESELLVGEMTNWRVQKVTLKGAR